MAPTDHTLRLAELVRNRLEAESGDDYADIWSTLQAAGERSPKPPAVIVYPLQDESARNVGGRATTVQRVTAQIGVMHHVAARNDPLGEEARPEAAVAVAGTRNVLIGWTPPDCDVPLYLLGGRLERLAEGRMQWLDRYAAEWILSPPGDC